MQQLTLNVHYDESERSLSVLREVNGERSTKIIPLDLSAFDSMPDHDIVFKSEFDEETSETPLLFPCSGVLRALRTASVLGITLGTSTKPGPEPLCTVEDNHCVMGYDIECEGMPELKSLPLPTDVITCASLVCSCGYVSAYRTRGTDSSCSSVLCFSNEDLCERLYRDIVSHSPIWLVGYNSYCFDNLFILSSKRDIPAINLYQKSGSGPPSLCFYVRGINNVDLLPFLDSRYRSAFSGLSLGIVSKELGLSSKARMPHGLGSESDYSSMVKYNILDSELTMRIFVKLRVGSQLLQSCSVMKSCFFDTIRNATGMMCSSMLSSYSLCRGKILNWSKCTYLPEEFEGGLVLEPAPGFYKNVVVVDFKSMYPYIMLCASISHDNVVYVEEKNDGHRVGWKGSTVIVRLPNHTVYFRKNTDCVSHTVLSQMLEFREKFGAGDPHISASIKAATNSLFGSLGFPMSPIYSPRASQSITCIGRWLLQRAKSVFEKSGMRVIYGDTDSLFVTSASGEDSAQTVENGTDKALEAFHQNLSGTPFESMCLRKEPVSKEEGYCFSSAVILGKKTYILCTAKSDFRAKGVAIRRKDRISVTIDCYKACLSALSKYGVSDVARYTISMILKKCVRRVIVGECTLGEVSIRARVAGNNCLKYRGAGGNTIAVEETGDVRDSHVRYDSSWILRNIVTTLEPLLISCKLGSFRELLGMFEMI